MAHYREKTRQNADQLVDRVFGVTDARLRCEAARADFVTTFRAQTADEKAQTWRALTPAERADLVQRELSQRDENVTQELVNRYVGHYDSKFNARPVTDRSSLQQGA